MRWRTLAARLSRTPLHPQWLMGRRSPPEGFGEASGLVLDIGSASRWLEPFASRDAHYVALDYPATASVLYGTRPDVFADACRLPLADASVDCAACLEVLEHVRDPEAALREIARVLKPGAQAFISMPFLYPIHDAPHDFQRWTEHGWRMRAEAAGFVVRRLESRQPALHAAAVLASLAVVAPLQHAGAVKSAVLLPFASVIVLAINLAAWALALVWPSWRGMPTTYEIRLTRTA